MRNSPYLDLPLRTETAAHLAAQMFNSLELYADAGRKAARAVNEGDAARANFERQHVGKMLALETPDNRRKAREAYDEAYRATRKVPRVPS